MSKALSRRYCKGINGNPAGIGQRNLREKRTDTFHIPNYGHMKKTENGFLIDLENGTRVRVSDQTAREILKRL